MVNNCMFCMYIKDWTRFDAIVDSAEKEFNENKKFLEWKTNPNCLYCKPKQRIPPDQWKELKMYYALRGIKIVR